jgi:5-(hydroxymethyl)furfural/furfural oxidase
MDFDGPLHGKEGRIPVRRIFPDQWTGHARAAAEAFKAAGFAYLPDQNGEWRDGYYPIAISNAYERRVSAAIGYLDPATRQRPNLTISTDTQVAELLFEGRRCVGVAAEVKGTRREFRAREVILSCGAIHSPAHLLRAGIGPVGHLKGLGIEVRAALEGVGQRLMDHPSISVSAYVKPAARINEFTRRHIHVGLRYSSGLDGMHEGDMFVVAVTKSSWHAVGERIASFLIAVYHTASERGQVKLSSADWREEPEVEFNLLSDRRDLERLMQGFRRMGKLYATAPMQSATADPFPASYSDRVRKIGVVNTRNRILTRIAGTLLDGPSALRGYLIRNLITEGFAFEDVMADDDALEAFVRKATIGVWHASCSCRMGADTDPMAVTDPEGRVRGVAGLRVVDASIFPLVPCANTNFPTLMAAEKIADAILA